MRLWSLHPSYLDAKGLVAAWREALLAQKILVGATHGYRQHPQLIRFRAQEQPRAAVSAYLRGIHREATSRGYTFDVEKIVRGPLLAGESELTQPGPDWIGSRPASGDPARTDGSATARADSSSTVGTIPVTRGQLEYEAELLVFKLRMRAPQLVEPLEDDLRHSRLRNHPLFGTVPGGIEPWEKVRNDL